MGGRLLDLGFGIPIFRSFCLWNLVGFRLLGEVGLGVLPLFFEVNSCGCWSLRVRAFYELYFSFEENLREIDVFRRQCSIVGRLPPICSWLSWICSGVFIHLPAVWIRRVREAFIGFTVGCWAYEACGEHNQSPMANLSWDWKVCTATVKNSNLSRICLCVDDAHVCPVYLDDLLLWCYLWMCSR